MIEILRIILIFMAIVLLLRLKWNIGYVMFIASALLFVMYLSPVAVVVKTIKDAVTDAVTIKLFFALTLIRALEMILREKQILLKMTEASRNFFKRKKAVIISMPMLIGLLPSLGGAYFSAPMVDESTKGLNMSPEEKGFINYWFRHPWELILPLYPGILLASALTKTALQDIILANAPYSLILLITGFLFSMKGINGSFAEQEQAPVNKQEIAGAGSVGAVLQAETSIWKLSSSFLPIACILILVILFHIELHYSLGITILALLVFYRFRPKEIIAVLKYGFATDVVILISGTMLFKFAMENSGAVRHLNQYFIESGIPVLPVLFAVPFITGMLTGLTIGFVGGVFPLIISLTGGAHLWQLSFAFASGYVGVLLSPVHLCLVLTKEYFKADMWGIYKKTIPASAIIITGAFAEYILLK